MLFNKNQICLLILVLFIHQKNYCSHYGKKSSIRRGKNSDKITQQMHKDRLKLGAQHESPLQASNSSSFCISYIPHTRVTAKPLLFAVTAAALVANVNADISRCIVLNSQPHTSGQLKDGRYTVACEDESGRWQVSCLGNGCKS